MGSDRRYLDPDGFRLQPAHKKILAAVADLSRRGRKVSNNNILSTTGITRNAVGQYISDLVTWDKLRRVNVAEFELVSKQAPERDLPSQPVATGTIIRPLTKGELMSGKSRATRRERKIA